MRRTVVTLAALAALSLSPLAAGAQAPLDVRFQSPAQAGPEVAALDATWLLLVFGPEGSGNVSLGFTQSVLERNVTAVSMRWDDEVPPPETVRTVPAFGAEARFQGLASIYLQGDRIRMEAAGAHASLLRPADDCLSLLPGPVLKGREARYDRLCPPGGGPAVALGADEGLFDVRIEAEGLQVVEYHHAEMSCRGSPDCPGDGMRHEATAGPPGLGLTVRALGYHRLESGAAAASGSGRVAHALVGAPALDLVVQGWIRLPIADAVAACDGCQAPDGQTLRAEGNLTLTDLRVDPDGRLAANLGGDVRRARLDERDVDPALLGLGLAVGASVAAAAATAWAARALAAFFSRIPAAESLEHPRRRLIMEAIRENPGIHLRGLARLAGGSPTLANYHVAVLVRNGHAVARRRGRQVCLFENHGRYGDEWKALAALRERPLLQLHGLVESRPGMSRLDVVRAALESWGWSRRTTYHRLRRLERVGLVQSGNGPGAGLQAFKVPSRPSSGGGHPVRDLA